MSKRLRLRWGMGIFVAMAICAAIVWVNLFSNPLSGIDEVSKVAAFGFYGADGGPVKFDVPVEHWPRIKAALGNPTRDFFPAKWVKAGSLDVTTRTGRKLCVTLYRTDFSIGAYSAGPQTKVLPWRKLIGTTRGNVRSVPSCKEFRSATSNSVIGSFETTVSEVFRRAMF